MTFTEQTLPAVTIKPLGSGLLRLEDETLNDPCIIDLHPLHVQLLASMIDRPMPDRTRAVLAKLHGRIEALHNRASEMTRLLERALKDGEGVGCELTHSEHITDRLADLAQDLAELVDAPDPGEPLATEGAGGQLTIAM